MLETGDAAPDFTLPADDGSEFTLSKEKGSRVLIYFYPKDDTPGCTAQACDLRDGIEFFRGLDVKVVGVSPDSVESHRKFREKYDLNFPLLADEEHAVAEAYGVWKEKKNFGRTYMGIERSSFLVGADGTIAKAWYGVRAKQHAEMLRDYLGD